jgi:hypothetical protein
MATKPSKLEIRAYNVGFGDCFLLSFVYAENDKRHVLVDFGMKPGPADADNDYPAAIAENIRKVCGGKLTAIVATHRHQDHISGFTTRTKASDPEGPGDIIRACAANALVVQPWTEDPKLKPNATGPVPKTALTAFTAQLESMHSFANAVTDELQRMPATDADAFDPTRTAASGGPNTRMGDDDGDGDGDEEGHGFGEKTLLNRLTGMALNALSNKPAIDNLEKMPGPHKYVFFGADSGLGDLLPGVKVRVLGPPTIDQWKHVKTQTAKDKDEFWLRQHAFWNAQALNTARATGGTTGPLFPGAAVCEPQQRCGHDPKCEGIPRASEWFVRRLRGVRLKQITELVKSMDSAMNNTSVILLFEAGSKKLLFPGDAQIENWEWSLKESPEHEEILEQLAEVDVYKVGHHGSLNATPKTLWNNFSKRDKAGAQGRLRSLISTMEDVFGESPETKVPRTTLVAALKKNTDYHTTQKVSLSDLCFLETIDLS